MEPPPKLPPNPGITGTIIVTTPRPTPMQALIGAMPMRQ
ncbi:hypothetical protein NK6_4066 [Bradyrhizobium diazoefficiens]|uniref:Uncharacterized protein n=1 Tax=Bradyrhizobium diazoefficiens TaxID=1355477 RepID=A0A0E4BPX2_9BRAD|nr:hypothetical protein NK6_4066 [Bradyrhizobium diazoefficiens]